MSEYKYDVYISASSRFSTDDAKRKLVEYIRGLEDSGLKVYYPIRDTDQSDMMVYKISMTNADAIKNSHEIHIYWNEESQGYLFDLGVALVYNKPLIIINPNDVSLTEYKSYANMISYWANLNTQDVGIHKLIECAVYGKVSEASTVKGDILSPGDGRMLKSVIEQNEKRLILTVGLPRSGKSTWAREQGFPIVCPDSIRLAMSGIDFLPALEPYVWAIAYTMVESLFFSGHNTVILDACNVTEANRERWKNSKWKTLIHEIPCGTVTCIKRARETNKENLVDVITRMSSSYVPVDSKWGLY